MNNNKSDYENSNNIYFCIYLNFLLINTGIFPDILKTSKVIVIYKQYNRCDY